MKKVIPFIMGLLYLLEVFVVLTNLVVCVYIVMELVRKITNCILASVIHNGLGIKLWEGHCIRKLTIQNKTPQGQLPKQDQSLVLSSEKLGSGAKPVETRAPEEDITTCRTRN